MRIQTHIKSQCWATFILALIVQGMSANSFAQYQDSARYAFASSSSEKSIQVIDIHSKEIKESIPLDLAPDSVIASDRLKALIIPHAAHNRLTLIDLLGKPLTKIEYPLQISPSEIYLSPLGDTAAIIDSEKGVLEVHALKRETLLLRAENVETENDLTFNLDGSSIYWTNSESGSLENLDLWSESRSLNLAKPGSKLSAMTRSTDGRLGFISIYDSNLVVVVELQSMKLLATVPVGAGPGRPWGTSDGQYMLIPNTGDNTLSAISTFSLTTTYTVPSVPGPISINPGWLDSVAAVVGNQGEMAFFDIESGTLLKSHDLESKANEGVVTSDSKTLALSSAGSVTFFDMRRQSLISHIEGLPEDLGSISLAVSNNLCH